MRLGLVLAPIALVAGVSCGNAPDTVQGGESLFAPAIDCTPTASACGTWTHMYGCYFGPAAANGGCAGSEVCHATAAGTGATTSGFVCGTSQASCYEGITSSSVSTLMELVNPTAKRSLLLTAKDLYLAGTSAGVNNNNMPTTGLNQAPYTSPSWPGFQTADIQCITDWVNAGAPND